MKLPQDIEGIYREGRTDAFTSSGVEALWFKKAWRKAKGLGGRVVGWASRNRKKLICAAKCARVPGWAGKAACAARCAIS